MAPSNKVMAGALAGALTIILGWVLKQYGHVELPAEVAGSAQVVITFFASYFVPDKE